MDKDNFEILLKEDEINSKVENISKQLTKEFKDKDKPPVFVPVLKGAYPFAADLLKKLDINLQVEFLEVSSYGNSLNSSGNIRVKDDIDKNLKNRDIIIIEDIIDTGNTIKFLYNKFEYMCINSITIVSLLVKNDVDKELDFNIDHYGFKMLDKFVVGYGLDYKQLYRNLNSIYYLKNSNK